MSINRDDLTQLASALSELMGGRRNAIARYWENPNSKGLKKGYAPIRTGQALKADYVVQTGEVITNRTNSQTQKKERYRCKPWDAGQFMNHIKGKERFGIYCLDENNHVKFIAADFDDHEGTLNPNEVWQEVYDFWAMADEYELPAYIERSKSGTGFHVWIFFSEAVPASHARAMGKWLFEESELMREGDDFSTFDRFFPAQSELPKGAKGFGNLIGLPLHWPSVVNGNNTWIDPETREPYPEQVTFTQSIVDNPRLSKAQLIDFMSEHGLEPETLQTDLNYTPRDPDSPVGTEQEAKPVIEKCNFIKLVSAPENQKNASEPAWFAMVSNLCRFDIRNTIHEASRHHPSYSAAETDQKIDNCRSNSGPVSCERISELGFMCCPKGGCSIPSGDTVKSPAGLSSWAASRIPTKNIPAQESYEGREFEEDSPAPKNKNVKKQEPAAEQAEPAEAEWSKKIPLNESSGQPWPCVSGAWDLDNDGLFYAGKDKICHRPIWIDACSENSFGHAGVLLKFFDRRWRLKEYAFPRERLHQQAGNLAQELAMFGASIVPGKEKWLCRYLVEQELYTEKELNSTAKIGWYENPELSTLFVLPNQTMGKAEDGEKVVFQPDTPTFYNDTLSQKSTLKEWQDNVATPALGNPLLCFSIMWGLATPLLNLTSEGGGGIHLYGTSSCGKTTAAQCCASVWGCGADPQYGPETTSIRKWLNTANALEEVAALHNDIGMVLDEIGEADEQTLGKTIYLLAGGMSKGRSQMQGGLRAQKTWRVLFFSTGEKTLKQVLNKAGDQEKGGQAVRMPSISAHDPITGQPTIITECHGKTAREYTRDIKEACAKHYGVAGPTFVSYLLAQIEEHGRFEYIEKLKKRHREIEELLAHDVPKLTSENHRVLGRWALICLAGQLATEAGILPWELQQAVAATADAKMRWLSELGEDRNEASKALHHLRSEVLKNMFRLQSVEYNTPVPNTLGFRTDGYILLLEAGLDELCGEFDAKNVARLLRKEELLWPESETRLKRKSPAIKALNNTRPRVYWIKNAFLGDQVDRNEQTEEDQEINAEMILASSPT